MIFVLITNSKPGHASKDNINTTVMDVVETQQFIDAEIDLIPRIIAENWEVGQIAFIDTDILIRIE